MLLVRIPTMFYLGNASYNQGVGMEKLRKSFQNIFIFHTFTHTLREGYYFLFELQKVRKSLMIIFYVVR